MYKNEKNLKDISKRSDHRQLSSKGGKNSGESRRRKKEFKELCNQFAEMELNDDVKRTIMKKAGFEKEDLSHKAAMVYALGISAENGDVRAFEIFRDTSGEQINKESFEIEPINIDFSELDNLENEQTMQEKELEELKKENEELRKKLDDIQIQS